MKDRRNRLYCPLDDERIHDKRIINYLFNVQVVKDLEFVVTMSRDDIFCEEYKTKMQKLIDKLNDNGIKPHRISFVVYRAPNKLLEHEWERIKEVEKFLKRKQIKFGFESEFDTFKISEVEKANAKLGKFSDFIKSKNFSPLEKLMAAYITVTHRKYTKEDQYENPSASRSIYSVLNGKKIVCVGYCSYLKALMELVGEENVKLYTNEVQTSLDNLTRDALHENLIVKIKDEKYGIDGYYYLDPTWDSSKMGVCPKLNHFLLPLKDVKNFKDIYVHSQNKRFDVPRGSKKHNKQEAKIANKKLFYINTKLDGSFSRDGYIARYRFVGDFIDDNRVLVPELIKEIGKEQSSKAVERLNILKYRYLSTKSEEDFRNLQIELINNIAFNEKDKVNTSEVITNHMLKNSKPIRLFHISKALSEVYTKTASKVTGKDAYKFVEKTVERNIERAKRMFNEDAINDFYAYDDAEKFDMEEFGLEEREEL